MSLPNKVFDYLQAETPVISSPVKEIMALIDRYQFGEIVNEVSANEISEKLNKFISTPELLKEYALNCRKYKTELTWEKEVKVLDAIYV